MTPTRSRNDGTVSDASTDADATRVRASERFDGSSSLLIDTHVHTDASYDSSASVEDVVAAAVDTGLDGIVVTDHDTTANVDAAREAAVGTDLLVIPGVEASTADGHLLGIGVTDAPPANRPLHETAAVIRAAGGVAVVPHPFQRSRHGTPSSAIRGVDGIEVWNAHTLTGIRNDQARRFAAERGYPRYGGSDAHQPEAVGAGATEVFLPEADRDSYAGDGGSCSTAHVRRRGTDRNHSSDATSRRAVDSTTVLTAMRSGQTRARGFDTSARRYVRKVVHNVSIRTTSLL